MTTGASIDDESTFENNNKNQYLPHTKAQVFQHLANLTMYIQSTQRRRKTTTTVEKQQEETLEYTEELAQGLKPSLVDRRTNAIQKKQTTLQEIARYKSGIAKHHTHELPQ